MKEAVNKARLRLLKARIAELEKRKAELRNYLCCLQEKYLAKQIVYSQYVETLYKKFEGKDLQEWIEHFDEHIKDCRKKISKEGRFIFLKAISIVVFSSAALVFAINYILAKI